MFRTNETRMGFFYGGGSKKTKRERAILISERDMEPELKKQKINPPLWRRAAQKKIGDATSSGGFTIPKPQGSRVDDRIQHARNAAVTQARQDGATGNFRIFDSPFGNFLLPVVPTRAELAG